MRPPKHTPYEQAQIADNWHKQPEWVTKERYAASQGVSRYTLRQYLLRYGITHVKTKKSVRADLSA